MNIQKRIVEVILCSFLAVCTSLFPSFAIAQTATKGASGLPIPRFVSLKAKRVNMRVGPGQSYKVAWLYMRSGIPMEVIQEYDNWRRVRDFDGTEGWVYHSLLSGQRTAVAAPWMRNKEPISHILVYKDATKNSSVSAKLEPGVIVNIELCNGEWCKVVVGSANGWISQDEIWGVYPQEAFK